MSTAQNEVASLRGSDLGNIFGKFYSLDWWTNVAHAWRGATSGITTWEYDQLHAHRWLAHTGYLRSVHPTVVPV